MVDLIQEYTSTHSKPIEMEDYLRGYKEIMEEHIKLLEEEQYGLNDSCVQLTRFKN
ncbi:MAG: hypothetical protein WC781_02100 [Candidatus Pacearchaeota archaeon]|jgi:hypothetical protein